ncbi:MAG: N-acetylneuraminate synthase family protein [Paraglaciecola sp.]|uniref:N-acetylneuraminate synthase family protein n=1 Tax=Paraglaciecola sp. TaxID=1920173 RepID=UPI003263D3FD
MTINKHSNEIFIGKRPIGYNHAPLVIAEIGINHGGDLTIAKAMVKAAVDAGAEVVKHQTHVVEDEMSSLAMQTIPGNANKSIYEIMSACALNEQDEFELMEYTQALGAIFISTPFSRAAADRLAEFNIPAFKIGSGECNNYPLLKHIAEFGKPIILSTGMNTIESVEKSVDILRKYCVPFSLLHTTNLYPTPNHLVRLGAMSELGHNFPDAVIGLSDHTTSNHACFGAVALGASILERHFTDSMTRHGPDICCSMDPSALAELIEGSRIIAAQRGGDKKSPLQEEQVTRDFAFSTVVTIKPIKKGETLDQSNVWVKRPGVGKISAEQYENVLGKKANRAIDTDVHLDWPDLIP